jgi:hypothetical protein
MSPTPRHPGLALLLLLLAVLPLAGAAADAPRQAAPAGPAQAVMRALANGDGGAAARAMAYPESFTPAQRSEDVAGLTAALGIVTEQYGRVVSASPGDPAVQYYDVWLSTGPRRGWWEAEGAETRLYAYDVVFANYGKGYLTVATARKASSERPVGVSFGLPLDAPESRARGELALNALYDLMGVPADHPIRRQRLPVSQVPAAPR